MKTIGLIGGLTWLSTLDYYRLLNEQVNEKKGGSEVVEIILYCKEIPIIFMLSDCTVLLFDTVQIHSRAAVEFALQ